VGKEGGVAVACGMGEGIGGGRKLNWKLNWWVMKRNEGRGKRKKEEKGRGGRG
jgi:hypothetical protein